MIANEQELAVSRRKLRELKDAAAKAGRAGVYGRTIEQVEREVREFESRAQSRRPSHPSSGRGPIGSIEDDVGLEAASAALDSCRREIAQRMQTALSSGADPDGDPQLASLRESAKSLLHRITRYEVFGTAE